MVSPIVSLPDLWRLHAFIVLADELHFRRAAARLAMRQSPLSRLIKQFESDLGIALFSRNRRKVKLTLAGEQFLLDVQSIVAQTENAVQQARLVARRSMHESANQIGREV